MADAGRQGAIAAARRIHASFKDLKALRDVRVCRGLQAQWVVKEDKAHQVRKVQEALADPVVLAAKGR